LGRAGWRLLRDRAGDGERDGRCRQAEGRLSNCYPHHEISLVFSRDAWLCLPDS
jgi:hypothetical protein